MPSVQDNYYQLETTFQEETAKYLEKLKELERVLGNRTTGFGINLYRRVEFVTCMLESELIRAENKNRKPK